MIKGILFDKDGTLIEFEAMWHSIMTLVFDRIEEDGHMSHGGVNRLKAISGYLPEGFEPESMIQYLPTSKIVDCWAQEVAGEGHDLQTSRNYFHRLFELAATHEGVKVKQLPGVGETLAYLKRNDYYLGVATADTEKSMLYSLKKAEIEDYFHFFGSDNGYHAGKPDPHMAEDFCHKMGITPDELLVVGDSVNDRLFAENVKANFVGIISGYGAFSGKGDSDVPLIEHFKDLIEVMAL